MAINSEKTKPATAAEVIGNIGWLVFAIGAFALFGNVVSPGN